MPDTTDPPKGWLASVWLQLKGRILISAMSYAIASATGLILFITTPLSNWVTAMVQVPARLEAISSDVTAQIDAISIEVAELREDVAQANGDNRVIRQPRGLSYVTEPVHVGEEVVFNLVIERTTLGANCNFLGGQSLFTEAGGIMTPGSALPATTRRLAERQTRLHLRLTPPVNLRPGRIELYLALEYDCDGKTVFDRTDTVVYQLLPTP